MTTTTFVDHVTPIEADWLNDVDAHVYDNTLSKHTANQIAVTPSGNLASTDVQAALTEIQTELDNVQPYDAQLTTLSGLSADQATYATTYTPTAGQFSLRNKIINGAMGIDQRNAGVAQTITAAAALAYSVDRWYAYCTGANVTGQRVAGTAPNQYNYQFTGAASVTKIGFAQRIEAANCQDLANTAATLSVDLANSLLTTVTWTAWYASTADTFGTLASPTRTQIATGTFTVNSTLTRYSTNISIPAAATTGIEIELSVAAQTSGTWTIGRVQLEAGSIATPFEHRPYGTELALCQRYYEFSSGVVTHQGYVNTAAESEMVPFKVTKRGVPTCVATHVAVIGYPTTDPTVNDPSVDGFRATKAPSGSGSGYYQFTWIANAEL